MCEGKLPVAVALSPKLHCHCTTLPVSIVDASVKTVPSLRQKPEVVNAGTGCGYTYTGCTIVSGQPLEEVTTSETL